MIAAEQHASRLVVPTSQRSHPTGWGSHKDHAAKALSRLAGSHLPASLKQLEKAIAQAHGDYERTVNAAQAEVAAAAGGETDPADETGVEGVDEMDNLDEDQIDYDDYDDGEDQADVEADEAAT